MNLEQIMSWLPEGYLDSLGVMWPAAAGGLVFGVTVFVVAIVIRSFFDIVR